MKRLYRNWRKGKIGREIFIEGKRKMREIQEKKQREKRVAEEEELKKLKNEEEVWRFINKKRKKMRGIENNIKKGEWRKHFMELLEGGEEFKENRKGQVKEVVKEEQEDRRGVKEIWKAVKKMKSRKACGVDGIPMEAWKYAGEGVKKGLEELLNQIWEEGTIPKDWRTSIIVPLYKRGDKEKTGNYRGISLLCSAYKIYAEVLKNRLEEEEEYLEILPESQAGFRRGRSTMDNIFILNHLSQREKRKGKGEDKVYAFFVDLKAAFDNVDRDKLWETLKDKGINREVIGRLEKIYEETEVMIRMGEEFTDKFWTRKGVRQGCVLSPLLFNLYIADIDRELKRRGIGGIAIGKERIWTLSYADDIVVLAKNREALLDMMDTLGRFLKERKLELSAEKSKIIVFNRKGREKNEVW